MATRLLQITVLKHLCSADLLWWHELFWKPGSSY